MQTIRLFFVLNILILLSINLMAQSSEVTMMPILNQTADKILEIEEDYNTIVRMEFDIVFKGSAKSTFRDLYSTRTYYFQAFGDNNRIEDVDIVVYQKEGDEWIEIAKDNSENSEATLQFKPSKNANYKINITAYKFKDGYTAGHYGLVIYHD